MRIDGMPCGNTAGDSVLLAVAGDAHTALLVIVTPITSPTAGAYVNEPPVPPVSGMPFTLHENDGIVPPLMTDVFIVTVVPSHKVSAPVVESSTDGITGRPIATVAVPGIFAVQPVTGSVATTE
jgi:hypothetical protein